MKLTAITINDDLAARIEELRRQRGLSLVEAVDLLLRDGLKHQLKAPKSKRFRIRTHPLRLRAGFDPAKLNVLSGELESEALPETQVGYRRR